MRVMFGAQFNNMYAPIYLSTRKLNTQHIIQSMAMYINRGTHAYYEYKSITIMYPILIINDGC